MVARAGTLVEAETDGLAEYEFASALGDVRGGRVVAELVPGASSGRMTVADAVLRGLGKNLRYAGTSRDANDRWDAMVAWLIAERARELFIIRAHLLDRRLIEQLAGVAAQVRARLWFIVARTGRVPARWSTVAEEWNLERIHFDEFRQRCSDMSSSVSRPAGSRAPIPFPEVPAADFASFPAACQRLLKPAGRKRALSAFETGFKAAGALLHQTAEIDERRVAVALADICRGVVSTHEMVCLLRGAQWAFFEWDMLLKVAVPRLAAEAARMSNGRLEGEVVVRLREYMNPRHAAIGALAALTHQPTRALSEVDLAATSADARQVTVGRREYAVPADASALLIAQVVFRQMQGASPTDPLFIYAPGGGGRYGLHPRARARPHGLQMTLRQVAADTGIRLGLTGGIQPTRNVESWMRRHGVSLQAL